MNIRYRVELSEAERGALQALLSGGKRAARKLTGIELEQRLCDHYRCQLLQPLAQQVS